MPENRANWPQPAPQSESGSHVEGLFSLWDHDLRLVDWSEKLKERLDLADEAPLTLGDVSPDVAKTELAALVRLVVDT
ncbi:GGDEF-domain containing protein, partial [Rhizobium sp. SEMIA 4085]|nr:GGDEF-domain containing protein [Rhizobium sp. SEMIA 4085]